MATFNHLRELQKLDALTACANEVMEDDLCDVIDVGEHFKHPQRNQPHDDPQEVVLSKEFKETFGFTKENLKI